MNNIDMLIKELGTPNVREYTNTLGYHPILQFAWQVTDYTELGLPKDMSSALAIPMWMDTGGVAVRVIATGRYEVYDLLAYWPDSDETVVCELFNMLTDAQPAPVIA